MANLTTSNEVWKDILGYEGLYQISNLGRVKSIDRIVFRRKKDATRMIILKGRVLSYHLSKKGYAQVVLSKNGKTATNLVHRIVACHFIQKPLNKEAVNHINCIKDDNRAINLEWCTNNENTLHAKVNKLLKGPKHLKGEYHPMVKLVEKEVVEIKKMIKDGSPLQTIANKFNVSKSNIYSIKKEDTWYWV